MPSTRHRCTQLGASSKCLVIARPAIAGRGDPDGLLRRPEDGPPRNDTLKKRTGKNALRARRSTPGWSESATQFPQIRESSPDFVGVRVRPPDPLRSLRFRPFNVWLGILVSFRGSLWPFLICEHPCHLWFGNSSLTGGSALASTWFDQGRRKRRPFKFLPTAPALRPTFRRFRRPLSSSSPPSPRPKAFSQSILD